MEYKIAVATSDGVHIDQSFGAASAFRIYTVTDGKYELTETRKYTAEADGGSRNPAAAAGCGPGSCDVASGCSPASGIDSAGGPAIHSDSAGGCGPVSGSGFAGGCGTGGCGMGSGCGAGGVSPKMEMLSDVRCLLCAKIGFQVQKQLEKKAITGFDISGEIPEILGQITKYYERLDTHQSLRGWRRKV